MPPLRVLVTGASRGIGAAIAREFADRQAHVALLARSMSAPSHRLLRGTLMNVACEVSARGGMAFAFPVDLRDPVRRTPPHARPCARSAGSTCSHNASALDVEKRPSPGRASLVLDVNVRGTVAVSLACADALRDSGGAMVSLSPPVDTSRLDWIAAHPHYTVSKYAMSLATLGFAADGIRANTLWPARTVATAATERLEESQLYPGAFSKGRPASDVARAVVEVALSDRSGQALLDEDVLPHLLADDGAPPDLFVDAVTAAPGSAA